MTKTTALLVLTAVLLSGCMPKRVSLHDLQEYDQAIGLAEKNGLNTVEMHKHLVELLGQYLKNPAPDPYLKALNASATAQQMQALNGSLGLLQQQQQYNTSPPPMSPSQFQQNMPQFGR